MTIKKQIEDIKTPEKKHNKKPIKEKETQQQMLSNNIRSKKLKLFNQAKQQQEGQSSSSKKDKKMTPKKRIRESSELESNDSSQDDQNESDDNEDDVENSDDDNESDDNEEGIDSDEDEESNEEEEKKVEKVLIGKKRKGSSTGQANVKAKKIKIDETVGNSSAEEKTTLFLAFNKKVTEEEVKSFFKSNHIQLLEIRNVPKRRFCYVDLKGQNTLSQALKLNGKMFKEATFKIERAKKAVAVSGKLQKEKMTEDAALNERRLYITNLQFRSTKEEIAKFFPTATVVKIPTQPGSKTKLKGYGFLEFESEKKADEVLAKMQDAIIGGRPIKLSKVKDRTEVKKDKKIISNCLIVKQLSFDTTAQLLKKTFKKSTGARIVTDPKTKKSKGYGFIEFESPEDAEEAMSQMQGVELQGRNMVINIGNKKKTSNRVGKKNKKDDSTKLLKRNDKKHAHKINNGKNKVKVKKEDEVANDVDNDDDE